MTLVKDVARGRADRSGEQYEPWLFLTMLGELSGSRPGIGFVYSVLDLLAERYELTDAVVVLEDESLGTQAFRLGRRSVSGGSQVGSTPGVSSEPDVIPALVRDAVRNVCQISLTLHRSRGASTHGGRPEVANQQDFSVALRAAAGQSSRYGWPFTLVLAEVNASQRALAGDPPTADVERPRAFAAALGHAVRSGDTAVRIGDNLFAIILFNTAGTEVLAFTERLRTCLPPAAGVDFTIGTATSPADSTDPAALHRLAGSRLLEKKQGTPA